jgi:epoxide hydrolase
LHDLDDLHRRLDLTRLPEPETVPDATQGIELTASRLIDT